MKWYWILVFGLAATAAGLHATGILRFSTRFPWFAWVIVALAVLNGGWMAFDGGRALFVGDYVTPTTGRWAGRLGPWSRVVRAVGLEPRSTVVEAAFVVYGITLVGLAVAYLLGSHVWTSLVIIAVLGLWYVPFGTLINLAVLVLLFLPGMRHSAPG